jgi:hypothetical protein
MMWNTKYAGRVFGTKDGKGYFHVNLGGKFYRLHRLAFLLMNGERPVGEIDHKDHVRTNNKWDNLREVDVGTNRKNQRLSSKSTCGVTGVYYSLSQRVMVRTDQGGRTNYPVGFESHQSGCCRVKGSS